MREATPEEADRFIGYMSRGLGARIATRTDTVEFRLIQAILAAVGLPDLTKELDGRSFTIGPLVYLRPGLSPDETIKTTVHECCHTRQWRQDGLDFAYFYATVGEKRVAYEVEGFGAAAELQFARTRSLPSLDQFTDSLAHGYALGSSDLQLARGLFESRATSIVDGIVSTVEAQYGIDLLRTHFPELLAT